MKQNYQGTSTKTAKIAGMLALMSTLLFSGCNKQPAADFTTDQTEYTAGDVVKLTNKSLDAKSYKWTFPDGQTSAQENVDYALSNSIPAGVYSIKLQAISKKGNKTSDATKSFSVKAASGRVTVWTSNSNASQITVKIDNVTLGTITLLYSTNPECNANGCVSANLSVGAHSMTATDGFLTWTGTINITKDNCTTFQLQ